MKMISCIQSNYISIFKELGTELNLELIESEQNKNIIGKDTTKSFLEFLVIINKKDNLVKIGDNKYLCGKLKEIHTNMGSINENDIMKKINNYLDEKNMDYFSFVENCRRVTKNIIKPSNVRLDWKQDYLENAVLNYNNFINYLIK